MEPMTKRIYFDTVAFREIGKAFADKKLATDLTDRIVVSPITAFEVLSQLSITNADEVLRQIHAVHNWCVTEGTGLLAWPDDALYGLWFGKVKADDGFTKRMQKAFNVCLASESAEALREEAGKLKDVMDGMKERSAEEFARLLEAAKKEPLGENFSNLWFRGIASRIKADPASRPMAEMVSTLSSYHEFEETKLQVALRSKDYNPAKHKNDLLDAEQMIYLADANLHFLNCDNGFRNLVKKSPQAQRIVTVEPGDLADSGKVEALLRRIVGVAEKEATR
jgi:hypothetical protein